MGYPWYSERTGHAGKNGQFKISLEKNCETKEIRYVATLIDPSKRTNRKSMSSMDITELYNKVDAYVSKMETVQDGLTDDITEVFDIYGLHTEEETITETKEIKSIKISKEIETITVRGYMGKVEQIEAYKIDHPELELYLYKSNKYYVIYEKQTGKMLVSPKTTKKEAMNKLIETLNGYYDKLKDAITATIEKDGYITDYEIGSWIRST